MDKDALKEFITSVIEEQKDADELYDKMFDMLLDKYGVDGVKEMDKETRKDFFNDIEDMWHEEDDEIDKEAAKEKFSQEQIDKLMGERYFRTLGRTGDQVQAITEVKNMFTDE